MYKGLRVGVATLAVGVASVMVLAQEGQQGGMKMPSADEMKAMIDRWHKAMTPGDQHKKLAEFVGEWDVTFKMWMMGPDSPPTESKGSATVTSVLNGRFIREELAGKLGMPDMATGALKEMDYQGQGLTGFDNYRNTYIGSWADSMNTHMLRMAGTADPSGKVITMYGEMDEPMLNLIGRTVKYVTRIVDKDKHVLEIYDLAAGDNFKVLELTYTRKK